MTDFLITLSRDFANIMEDSDEYNVLIKVGADENDEKSFHAHSLVLRARSPYFKTALSNNWAKKENDITVFYKPNISPYIFELILKFISKDFTNLEEEILIGLLVRNDLDMEESVIWDHLLEWGIAQNPELTIDVSKWKNEDFTLLKETLDNLIPLTGLQLKSDYLQTPRYNGVKSSIIDKNHAAMLCSWIDGVDSTSIPNLTNYNGDLPYELRLLSKIGRVITNSSAYAVNDSQSTGPCFGDGDLWLRDQFDQPGNCSCNKESYDQSVGDMFHRDSWESWTGAVKNGTFAVEDYEVFQVIRKRINNT
ncbi:unnamed protein product [Rhizophagus irregularis]|nr:unnamed protein product [Rhizophagus irregularis]